MRFYLRHLLVIVAASLCTFGFSGAALAQRVQDLPMLRAQQQMQTQQPQTMTPAGPPGPRASAPAMPSMLQQQVAPPPPPAMAPEPLETRIAAVVNDNVITTTDIENRMRIAFLSSGLPDTPEVREKLIPQILRALIDEQLEMQEAKKLDISISKDDINGAMTKIQQDNHIPTDMRTYVSEHGVAPSALEDQIRAGMSWTKVVQRELRPHIDIGDDDVQAVIDRVRANAGKEEFLVSEIFLPVDSPKDEDQVKQFADNLETQLKGGANFGAVARQFSQGSSAATGGDIGWVQEGQLAPEINKVIGSIQPGQIGEPIRTSNGYHIIGVREKRTVSLGDPKDISVNLQQAFHPFDANDDKANLLQQATMIRRTFNSCDALKSNLSTKFPGWSWQDIGTTKMDRAPPGMVANIRGLNVGSGGEPIATDKGAVIIFLCSKTEPDDAANRSAIMNQIGAERLELQARRLLRDLRRAAYIDIRLGQNPS